MRRGLEPDWPESTRFFFFCLLCFVAQAGFMIKAAQFHFGGSGQDCPNLMEWVAEKNQETMYCWIQDHVNAFAQGQSCFGLRFPGSLAGG